MLDVLPQVCSSTKGNLDIVFELHIHWSQTHHEMSENHNHKIKMEKSKSMSALQVEGEIPSLGRQIYTDAARASMPKTAV